MKNTRLHRFQKQITQIILALLFAVNCSLLTANAAVPHLLNYQGRLTDASGNPLTGSYAITFRIYDAETAGNLLWEEIQNGVVIQKGIFSVLLGSVTALNLAFDKPYWLEIKVGSEVMSPRQKITSAGYAIRAETAEQAQNAAKINNIEVSTTATANKLLPLDSNAKLPVSALKVYDSGWFAATGDTSYVKTHNLGTTKLLISLYSATDANGATMYREDQTRGSVYLGSTVINITTTQLTVRTNNYFHFVPNIDGGITSGYLRVIALALE